MISDLVKHSAMAETQDTITAWADATFGKSSHVLTAIVRANSEMAELLRVLAPEGEFTVRRIAQVREECADVWIVLTRVADMVAVRLLEAEAFNDLHISNAQTPFCLAKSANATIATLIFDPAPDYKLQLGRIGARLRAIVTLMGGSLEAEIDCKMAINRSRRWEVDGHGHGYHVKHMPDTMPPAGWRFAGPDTMKRIIEPAFIPLPVGTEVPEGYQWQPAEPGKAAGWVRPKPAFVPFHAPLRHATEAELAAQRESWVRGEMGMGLDRQEDADRQAWREERDRNLSEKSIG